MDLVNRKRIALEQRRNVDQLVVLFEEFQRYIENIHRASKGEISQQDFLRIMAAFNLRLEDQEYRFREWDEGRDILNYAIFTLARNPEQYSDELLILATVKFEHLLEKEREELEALHEELALYTSETDAQSVTHFEPAASSPSMTQKVEVADQLMEKAFKWGNRVVQIAPWLEKMLQHFQ